MTGGDEEPKSEPIEDEPTVVADPVVVDLRDGVDTVAAYAADQERRASAPDRAS